MNAYKKLAEAEYGQRTKFGNDRSDNLRVYVLMGQDSSDCFWGLSPKKIKDDTIRFLGSCLAPDGYVLVRRPFVLWGSLEENNRHAVLCAKNALVEAGLLSEPQNY